MPVTPTYPGVYIEEVSSGVHPITGVATSITAFVGFAQRGPVNEPTMVQSFPEFIRVFGGLVEFSTMSYAVQQFFLNGGRDALIVRCARLSGGGTLATKGTVTVGGGGAQNLTLRAANEGSWSGDLRVRIDHDTKDKDEPTPTLYNVSIKDAGTGFVEVIRNLPLDASAAAIIEQQSVQVRATNTPSARPEQARRRHASRRGPVRPGLSRRGSRRCRPETTALTRSRTSSRAPPNGLGMYSLARADLFNLLCITPVLHASDTGAARVLSAAAKGKRSGLLHRASGRSSSSIRTPTGLPRPRSRRRASSTTSRASARTTEGTPASTSRT